MFNKLVLFGDNVGIPQLLDLIPLAVIKGFVISATRPQYFNELKSLSSKNNIPLLVQPKFGSPEYERFSEDFRKFDFDLLLCNCYSLIIRNDILENVKYNALNVHWALLPKNRGPNPTQWAIIKDEKKTGVTIHYMNDELDSGDIVSQVEEPISDADTWLSVNARLKNKAGLLIQQHIDLILEGMTSVYKQDESQATINKRLTPEFPKIDFDTMTDRQVFNLIRAQVHPLTGAFIKRGTDRIYLNSYTSLEEVKDLRKKYAA